MNGKNDITEMTRREFLGVAATVSAGFALVPAVLAKKIGGVPSKFHFTVLSDSHMCNKHREFGDFALKAVFENKYGPGAFLLNNGDFDPFERVEKATRKRLLEPLGDNGAGFCWYTNTGNHDMYNTSNDPDFRTDDPEKTQIRKIIAYNKSKLKNIVNWGPEFESKLPGYENNGSKYTNYSFDYGNCHFVVLDMYYPNTAPARGCANFHKVTEKWLDDDLKTNKKKNVMVFGHQPIIPYKSPWGEGPKDNNLVNFRRKKMWDCLKRNKVEAFFCGHTHIYGVVKKDGITQINTGKSGIEPNCTYVMVFVDGDKITYKSYVYRYQAWKVYDGVISV